ncbi:acyltransferase [uncultured Ruminococcus sp.]|uniref:acyltransferase n=1 Tax=uncultured Ruminococcus sp. TaxID=165186 RepID=UPI002639C83F|nr:acyltransferase [uncultured Ruminococcus sp.]
MVKKGRVLYLSRIKALACIAVVILHTVYTANNYSTTTGQQSLMLSLRNAMMWAVPCFVMASGALLLDRNRELSAKKLFGKYIPRMALALVVFSVLFSVFDTFTTAHRSAGATVKDILTDIFQGTGWPHMWYIYLMLAVYIMLPIYKLISSNAKANDIKYLLLVYTVFLTVLPLIETISGKKLSFYICVFTVYPLYLFLGHAMHTGIIKLPKNASGLMFLISLGIIAMLTVYSTSNASEAPEASTKINSMLSVYSFPVYLAASLGAFGYIRRTKNSEVPVLDTIAAELDSCSFGIYLIHMAVLKFIYAVMKFNPFDHGGTLAVIGIFIVTLAVSYAITRLLKLVPCVNRII